MKIVALKQNVRISAGKTWDLEQRYGFDQDETVRFYGFRFIFQTVEPVLRFYGSICMIDAVRFGSVQP